MYNRGMRYIFSIKEQELNEGNKMVASFIIRNPQQTGTSPPKSTSESNFAILDVFLVVKQLLNIS